MKTITRKWRKWFAIPLVIVLALSIALPLQMSQEPELVYTSGVDATSITLTDQDTDNNFTYVQFDIGWEFSWRDAENWDAIWVFVKYKLSGGDDWAHATLSTTGTDHSIAVDNGVAGTIDVGLNDASGNFTAGQDVGTSDSYGVSLGDVDGDGDLDAFVANCCGNKVWLNDGSGNFTVTGQSLGSSYSISLGDVDGDGHLDAFVVNDWANKVWLNDGDIIFSVTDTGIGIKEENLETIFDSFQQVGETAQIAGYEGTGLGLAISKQFIEMQGGKIWAESKLGKGSTFTFSLPKKKVASP